MDSPSGPPPGRRQWPEGFGPPGPPTGPPKRPNIFVRFFLATARAVGTVLATVLAVVLVLASIAVPAAVAWRIVENNSSSTAASASQTSFCSTMNAMTSYAIAHSNPSTTQEEEDSLNYVHKELTRSTRLPSEIQGTVSSMVSTTHELAMLLTSVDAAGTATTAQKDQAKNLFALFDQESSTTTKWAKAN